MRGWPRVLKPDGSIATVARLFSSPERSRPPHTRYSPSPIIFVVVRALSYWVYAEHPERSAASLDFGLRPPLGMRRVVEGAAGAA
jgi:hypothetical protein